MSDDKNWDQSKVSGEDSEVQHLAKEAGISHHQARELIKAYGNDRATLMRAAKSLLGNGQSHVRSSRI